MGTPLFILTNMSPTKAGLSPSDKSVCLRKRRNILKLNVTPSPVKYFCNKHWDKIEGCTETMGGKKENQRLEAKEFINSPTTYLMLDNNQKAINDVL